MRNIFIGYFIVEYEQNGLEKANYGEDTIKSLVLRLNHIKGISKTQLYRFRQFYLTYPQIFSAVSLKSQSTDIKLVEISPTVSGKTSEWQG